MGTLQVNYRYGDCVVVGEFVGHNTADCHKSPYVKFYNCLKQQTPMGQTPLNNLWIITSINFDPSHLKSIVTTNNETCTKAEIWCAISVTYTSTVAIYPIIIGSFTPEKNLSPLFDPDQLPTGLTTVATLKTS